MTVKTITETGKNQNWVEKCRKKVSKPIKPLAFPWKNYLWSTDRPLYAYGARIIFR